MCTFCPVYCSNKRDEANGIFAITSVSKATIPCRSLYRWSRNNRLELVLTTTIGWINAGYEKKTVPCQIEIKKA
jgi:hypothetical protein